MPGPNLIEVTSLADPALADYANLKDSDLRHGLEHDRGIFIAEGELVVARLIESSYRVRSVLLTSTRLRTAAPTLSRLPPATPVFIAPQDAMDQVVGFHIHRGIVAAADRGPAHSPDEVLAAARVAVILEDLANADNVGAVFRNVAALAGPAACILLSPGCCDPLYRKAVRVSIGNALHVPFARFEDWPGSLARVRRWGTIVALTPAPGARSIADIGGIQGPLALLLGAEGPGLSPSALAHADLAVRIPISPSVDSLNVATAAAIALHRLVA